MPTFRVINEKTDETLSSWSNRQHAEIAAAEANADFVGGIGPFEVLDDTDWEAEGMIDAANPVINCPCL